MPLTPPTILMGYALNRKGFDDDVLGYDCANFLEFDEDYLTFCATYMMRNFSLVGDSEVNYFHILPFFCYLFGPY